ncbi:tail protein X, partial [Enterococcus faecalis]|uniref:tail protein X n=1 Tax=Enterococcus faecalis TaxID=1351 RepID=UPI00403F32E7
MPAPFRTTTLAGDTLDLICWRELGTTTGGVVEQAYALNPGLADQGAALPGGIDV